MANVLKGFRFNEFKDEDLKRRIRLMLQVSYAALSKDKFLEYNQIVSAMQYNTLDVNNFHGHEYYDRVSTLKENFNRYLQLKSEAAKLNGYASPADEILAEYEDDSFETQMDDIIQQFVPLYKQLHAYVRFKLRGRYGDQVVREKAPLPLHIVGDHAGQYWEADDDLLTPYPDKLNVTDVYETMLSQNYTALTQFQLADEFFQSLNMTKAPDLFWNKSILEEIPNVHTYCHPSAFSFYLTDDVRIKQCLGMSMENFNTAHHEMGHIQYMLQYQHQPVIYQRGANPGFHEAIGDAIYLSVASPKHLARIGLLSQDDYDEEMMINNLMEVALMKIVLLFFGYPVDKFRFELYRGQATVDDNCRYWELRRIFGGVEPPVMRSNADFDVASLHHVRGDFDYFRYLVAFIYQYQFHEALCRKAGEYVPGDAKKSIHNCDIFGSLEAGLVLKEMMQLGASKPWPEAMEVITGQRRIDAGPALEYFKPLFEWLVRFNKENDVFVGWEPSNSK